MDDGGADQMDNDRANNDQADAQTSEYSRLEDVVAADPREQLLAEAIRTLTAAARLTRPVLQLDEQASAAEGRPVYRDGGRREPEDWAEFVAQSLAGAAANVGSVEGALAGRPGSWEADAVRRLLTGTVGHDGEYLLERRTEPVDVTVFVEEILFDLGADEAYGQANDEIDRRWKASGLDDVPDDQWTDEQQRLEQELAALETQIEELRQADWAAYGEAVKAAVEAAAARRKGLQVPITITVDVQTFRPDDQRLDGQAWGLAEQLLEEAIQATTLPGNGRPPIERLGAGPAS